MPKSSAARFIRPWPRGPVFTGRIYNITHAAAFFVPIPNGQGPP